MDQATEDRGKEGTMESSPLVSTLNSEPTNGNVVSQLITGIESEFEPESRKITPLEKASFEPSIVQEQEWRLDQDPVHENELQQSEQAGQLEQLKPLEHPTQPDQSYQEEQQQDKPLDQAQNPNEDEQSEKFAQERQLSDDSQQPNDLQQPDDPQQPDEPQNPAEVTQNQDLLQQSDKSKRSDEQQENPPTDPNRIHQENMAQTTEHSEPIDPQTGPIIQLKQSELPEQRAESDPPKQSEPTEDNPTDAEAENQEQVHSLQKNDTDIFARGLNADAVDKNMERVIDDIVQLDGCKQFAQALVDGQASTSDPNNDVEMTEDELDAPSTVQATQLDGTTVPNDDIAQSDKQVSDLTDEKSSLQESVPDSSLIGSPSDNLHKDDASPEPVISIDVSESSELKLSDDVNTTSLGSADTKEVVEESRGTPITKFENEAEADSDPASGDQAKHRISPSIKTDDKADDSELGKTVQPEPDEEPKRIRPIRSARLRASQAPPKEPEPPKVTTKPKSKQSPSVKLKIQIETPRKAIKRPLATMPVASIEPVVKNTRSSRSSNVTPLPAATKARDNPANSSRSRSLSSKHYECDQCPFATDRQNNIVLHKKSCCPGYKKIYEDYVDKLKQNLLSPKSNKKRTTR